MHMHTHSDMWHTCTRAHKRTHTLTCGAEKHTYTHARWHIAHTLWRVAHARGR